MGEREQSDKENVKENVDTVTKKDLLEMLCPNGYRAHKDVKSAVDKQGQPLIWVSNEFFTGWILAGKDSKWTKEMHRRSIEEGEVRLPGAELRSENSGNVGQELESQVANLIRSRPSYKDAGSGNIDSSELHVEG